MKIERGIVWGIVLAGLTCNASSSPNVVQQPWSQRMADAAIERWPDGRLAPEDKPPVWNYEFGTLLEGMDTVWLNTADPRYYNFVKKSVDQLVGPDGSIPSWKPEENRLDDILLGRQLLLLYGVTQNQRYAKAATILYQQILHRSQTPLGDLTNQQKDHDPMGLEALYAAEPFYAEYASTFHYPEAFSDITHQFALIEEHLHDAGHKTGDLSQFQARGMGWYMMALVDSLSYYPEGDAGRQQLVRFLNRDAAAVVRFQDQTTSLWIQKPDKGPAKGNDLVSSASCMFVYALARAVRLGYLTPTYLANAQKGYRGILSRFVETGEGGSLLTKPTKSESPGGELFRDSPAEIGAFVLASTEIENAQNAKVGRGQAVFVDAWFNSQKRADATGQQVYFHYKWDDMSDSGYSLLGHVFRNFGAETKTLAVEPTLAGLRDAKVYMIVSPDIPVKNPNPHYMQAEDASQIAEWVKAGGVLVIMENDPPNADIEHLNLLAERFGIHYNDVLRNHVEGNKYEMGKIAVEDGGVLFHDPHTLYMKDTCTISVTAPATSLLTKDGDILMAVARFGKGTVFATVDPWLYNEYTDGRKLPPAEYDNYAAGKELVRWILEQIPQLTASTAGR